MSETEYRRKLYEVVEIPAHDDLVIGHEVSDPVYISGAGEYKRGELLMSSGDNAFVPVTRAGLATARELCILCEDTEVLAGEIETAYASGYFEGIFNAVRIKLPADLMIDEAALYMRMHRIYVR